VEVELAAPATGVKVIIIALCSLQDADAVLAQGNC
jgi:hypothetical protein